MPAIRTTHLVIFLAFQLAAGQTLRDRGIAAFNEGRYSGALADLREAAKDKRDRTASAFLALALAATGDCASALPALVESSNTQEAPLNRMTALAAAKCDISGGRTLQAARLLDDLNHRFPDDPDVLYLQAKLSMKAFNDATLAMFQRTPSSYRVHELSAEIFEMQNRYTDAVAEYRRAIELSPNAPDLHYRLGRAMLLESHSPDALERAAAAFLAELRISPEDSACEFQLGQLASVQGQPAEAQRHFERAVALSPRFATALVALGKCYAQSKDYGHAISVLQRATAVQPDNEAAHYALLSAYRNAGQMENAQAEKSKLDRLQKPPEGEFSDFLKRLGEKPQQ